MASVRMLTVLLLNIFSSFVSSLHFHVGENEEKCFLQGLPDDRALIGRYWTQLYDEQRDEYLPAPQDVRISVVATDPDDKVILSQSYGSQGSFRFRSMRPGEHHICLQPSSPQRLLPAGGLLAVHLDMKVGERTNNNSQIAAQDKLTELQLRVRQLAELVEQIQKEQDYHRLIDADFRRVDHNTNMWLFYVPVFRSLYIVFSVLWLTNSW